VFFREVVEAIQDAGADFFAMPPGCRRGA
jgi:hypothetical protein